MSANLEMWVVYAHPKDFPDGFVVRKWTTCAEHPEGHPASTAAYAKDLREARSHIPPGKYRLGRFPEEDEAILETWL